MKRQIFILLALIILTGCKKDNLETEIKKISSTGKLLCVYKEQRTNEDTMYTSYYLYNFNSNGILEEVINNESIEFNTDSSDLKKSYKEELEEVLKEYEDIDGLTVKKNIGDNKYTFEVNIDVKNTDDITKEEFLLNIDRINLYKFYNTKGYICE